MNATTIHEAESVTRSIARWGSAAAAIIFGFAFVTDEMLRWYIDPSQVFQIGTIMAISAIFVGYALAWLNRFEVLGSVIALVSMAAVYVICILTDNVPPGLFFLAVGLPALFHLVAVGLHRHEVTHLKVKGGLTALTRFGRQLRP